MLKKCCLFVAITVGVFSMFVASSPVCAADAPKVSTFAPADDLVGQVDKYIASMKEIVADEEEYKDSEDKIAREANTLVILALALGLHDQENKYKAGAGGLMKAALDVAAAKDFASAKKTVDALEKVAAERTTTGGELKWAPAAGLPELMKQVPIVNTKLRRQVGRTSFKKKAKDTAGYSAVIAAIAQGTIADTSATKDAEQVKQWKEFSEAMRDRAGELNATIHQGDVEAAAVAMKKLDQSCKDCHAVFKPDVVTDAEKE